jgi:hypothetical protein
MAEQRVPEKGAWILAFLAWLAAALGVPTLAGAAYHRWVVKHLPLSITLGVVIAVGVGAAGLVHEVWLKRYKGRVIDWVGEGIDRRVDLFWHQYREHLLADLRYVDLRGLSGRFFDPDLSDVYVDLALFPGDPSKIHASDVIDAEAAEWTGAVQRQKMADFLGRPKPRVLAIIGAPGSGKTTLLRRAAGEMCMARRVRREGRAVPVLLYLRDHVARIVTEPQISVQALAADDLALYGLADRAGWLEQRLRAGGCVVMLDGLDEIARLEDRRAVAEWVRMQVIRYSGNDFVVTSRPLGYQNSPIEGALTVQVQPFTRGQVDLFVHRWCLAEERRTTGVYDETVLRKAEVEAEDLLARLRAAPALRALTVSPLLLTMIAIVHRHYGALPGSRAELYARICQVLLWSRQDAKKLKVEPRGNQKERLMRSLAFEMMRRKIHDISTAQAGIILRPMLRRIATDLSVQEVLYDAASNGLFIERENGIRAFAHQTFQEYLAAAHIADKNLPQLLAGAVNDPWWRETTLLYVASADAGPIVESCLAANTLTALTLAFDCAEEAAELGPALRHRLGTLLAGGFAPGADREHRRAMIAVTLTRHLRQVAETADGSRICSRPITTGIYRLFLEDMKARGTPRLEDAPGSSGKSAAEDAITGVRASDAVAFVDWVNEITGGQSTYRLPTHKELEERSARDVIVDQADSPDHSFWVTPDSAIGLPQLYPANTASVTISASEFAKQLEADFAGASLAFLILPLMVHACIAARVLEDRQNVSVPRAVTSTLDFLRHLTEALESGQAQDLSWPAEAMGNVVRRDLDDVRAVLRDIDRKLAYDSQDARDRADLIIAQRLASIVRHDLVLIRDLGRAPIAIASDQARNRQQSDVGLAINLELARSLESAEHADVSLASDSGAELEHHAVRAAQRTGKVGDSEKAAPDQELCQHTDSCIARLATMIMGHALSEILPGPDDGESSFDASEIAANLRIFSKRFAEVTAIGPADYTMSADSLPDTAQRAIAGLEKRLGDEEGSRSKWARPLTGRFASLIEGVLFREQRVEASIGLSLRIMALCLAVEAETRGDHSIGHEFKQIAAAITWLQRRHNGAVPAVEMLLLAPS